MQLQKVEAPQITELMIKEMVSKIAQNFHPSKIILFGSHVWGTPREWSDIDLLIIMEYEGYSSQMAAQISLIAKPRYVPIDILVRTPNEIEERLRKGDRFTKRILKEGRVLYDQPNGEGMDRKS